MRKSRIQVLAYCMMVATFLWSIYEWIFVDRGFRYFVEDWTRVPVVLAIGIIGALVLNGWQALAAERRRQVALLAVGILAALATGFAIYFIFLMTQIANFLLEAGGLWWALLPTIFPCAIAAYLWWAFFRIFNHKRVWPI